MDPAPVSIEQDGVYYKRVTQLPDGSWALMGKCCCRGTVDGCVILLLPCCDCPEKFAYIEDGPPAAAAWPFSERTSGQVVRMSNNRCYKYVATVKDPPTNLLGIQYTSADIEDFTTCSDPLCVDADCVGGGGAGGAIQVGDDCGQADIFCIDSATLTSFAAATTTFINRRSGPGELFSFTNTVGYTSQVQYEFPGASSTEFGSAVGRRWQGENGPTVSEWSYGEPSVDRFVYTGFPRPGVICANFLNAPPDVRSCDDILDSISRRVNHNFYDNCMDAAATETVTADDVIIYRSSIVHRVATAYGNTVYAYYTERVTSVADGSLVSTTISRRVHGRVWSSVLYTTGLNATNIQTDTDCEVDSTVLATKCDDESTTITVDLAEAPDLPGVTLHCYYEGDLYVVGTEASTAPPVQVVFTLEQCGEDPVEVLKIATLCGDVTTRITVDIANAPPSSITAVYQGNRYRITSEDSLDTPVPVVFSSMQCPFTNPCAGLIPNDPRCNDPRFRDCPQCVGFNVGDPIIIPTDPRGSTPPDNNGMIEALMSPIMRCKGCGG